MQVQTPASAKVAEYHRQGDAALCPVCLMLPPTLREKAEAHAHLRDYLHVISIEVIGVPQYVDSLNRSHRNLQDPNLIYPVAENIFVHIYPDHNDSRDFYMVVEPGMALKLDTVLEEVETRLVDLVHELDGVVDQNRSQLLLNSLAKVCTVGNGNHVNHKNGNSKRGSRVIVDREHMEALRYMIVRDKEGLGPLQPLILDTNIEDISCSGTGTLFVEHKTFGSLKSNITFNAAADLDSFVMRLSEKIGKPVTFRDPIVDATLPDGSRVNIVFGEDLSKRGSNFTIRKFSVTPMSIIDLIQGNTLTYQAAAYLSLVLGEGLNIFCSGETASGKTTLLNALTTFIPPTAKIVSIEDTPELQVPHVNWIREVVRGSVKTSGGSAVTMFDLLKAALRQRPNEIIIGEIRGEEGLIAFQAMQTGHAAMATFHAASVEKLIQRLTGSPINVPKTYVDNLNVVVIQSAVRLRDNKIGRRVVSINEILGYDSASDSFSFIEVFRYDPVNDTLDFSGNMNSQLLEHRIAFKRGIPSSQRRQIYAELERRSSILKRMQEQKITGFYEVYNVLGKAYRQGLFR